MRTGTGHRGRFLLHDGCVGPIILLTDSTEAAAETYAYDSWGLATTSPWTYAGGTTTWIAAKAGTRGAGYSPATTIKQP